MMAGILSLSHELHLQIIASLKIPSISCDDEDLSHQNCPSLPQDEDEQGSSKEHLIPEELKTLISLSCTCAHMRSVVGPHIYKKLWLTNTVKSAASVNAVSVGAYQKDVREILFVGRDTSIKEEPLYPFDNLLPPQTEDILANLRVHFPNLDVLNVGFAFELYQYPCRWESCDLQGFLDREDDERVFERETKESCRALTAKVWTAISRNTPGTVKSLKMRHFIPKCVSIYFSPDFEIILGSVEMFHISLWGRSSAGWVSSGGEGYRHGISQLGQILKGLTSCLDFTLEASQYGWVGCDGLNCTPFPILPDQLPRLKRLKLRHCLIGPELVDFLCSHNDTIENFVLQDCSADSWRIPGDGIAWADLFNVLYTMKALREVQVLPEDVPYTWSMEYPHSSFSEEQDEADEAKRLKCELEASNGGRRTFSYGSCESLLPDYCKVD